MKRIALAVLFVAVASASSLAADPLADLRANLAKLQVDGPVKARIDVKVIQLSKEEDSQRQSSEDSSVTAEAGPQGLKLSWAAQALAEARQAKRQRAANPEAKNQDGGLADLSAENAADLLSYADTLSLVLDGAKLLEDRAEPRQGKPARLFVFEPRERLRSSEKKMLKSREDKAKVWVDADGFPIAYERAVDLKLSKFLITFSVSNRESRTFSRVGGRLVVTYESTEGGGAGLGQSGETKRQTRVTILP